MRERGKELYGLEMSPHNSQLVACVGVVVVATMNDVVVVVGAVDVVAIWV